MKRNEWFEEIAKDCQFAKTIHGGAMCHEGKKSEFCEFHRCPKLELEVRES